jgi:hypothetical protein
MNAPQIPVWLTFVSIFAGIFGIGSIAGSLITQYVLTKQRHREWVKDNKKLEWRELIDKMDTCLSRTQGAFKHPLAERLTNPFNYMATLGIGSGVMNDRIFIAETLKKSGITQKWRDISAYVCASDLPRDENQQGAAPTLNGYIIKVNAFQDELIRVAREDLALGSGKTGWFKFWKK